LLFYSDQGVVVAWETAEVVSELDELLTLGTSERSTVQAVIEPRSISDLPACLDFVPLRTVPGLTYGVLSFQDSRGCPGR